MFARIKREEGVPVFHRKLGESTVSTNVASIDTSLLTCEASGQRLGRGARWDVFLAGG